jgi:hypothetical protein
MYKLYRERLVRREEQDSRARVLRRILVGLFGGLLYLPVPGLW